MNEHPKKNERWIRRSNNQICRIMADPIEGYVMYRFRGAMPNLLHVSAWHKNFERSK